jgi:hypothetical protein
VFVSRQSTAHWQAADRPARFFLCRCLAGVSNDALGSLNPTLKPPSELQAGCCVSLRSQSNRSRTYFGWLLREPPGSPPMPLSFPSSPNRPHFLLSLQTAFLFCHKPTGLETSHSCCCCGSISKTRRFGGLTSRTSPSFSPEMSCAFASFFNPMRMRTFLVGTLLSGITSSSNLPAM